jgi:hypothetical protein
MTRLRSERGVAFVISALIVTGAIVVTLTISNYVIHGDISVACRYMALPQAAC